jgi:hypothetical protein
MLTLSRTYCEKVKKRVLNQTQHPLLQQVLLRGGLSTWVQSPSLLPLTRIALYQFGLQDKLH